MKKILILLCFLFFLAGALYSLEGEFDVSLGVLGFSLNSDNEFKTGYVYCRLLNFMYQSPIGFGVTASPFILLYNPDSENSLLTFINLSLFYNFSFFNNTVLGPFVSLHTLGADNPRFVELRCGLSFSLRDINFTLFGRENIYRDSIFHSDFLIIECGYKYNTAGRSGFYFHIGLDFILALRFFGNEINVRMFERERR